MGSPIERTSAFEIESLTGILMSEKQRSLNLPSTISAVHSKQSDDRGTQRADDSQRQQASNGSAGGGRRLTYFSVSCSVCGRRLRASIGLFGKRVNCQHCGNEFHASDEAADRWPDVPANLRRANQLLKASGTDQ